MELGQEFDVPLDVKVELGVGLLLWIFASVSAMTKNVGHTGLIKTYQTKTVSQVAPRRNFRSVTNTRGKLFSGPSSKIPSFEETLKANPGLKTLVA